MNININKEQMEILNEKAKEANITAKELLDMMIEFFATMPQQDIKFFVASFSGEYEDEGCCSGGSCSTNKEKEESSCCGGGCH